MTGNKPISVVVAQIVALRREKLSYRQISERLNVSKSACQRAWKLFEATGHCPVDSLITKSCLVVRQQSVIDACVTFIEFAVLIPVFVREKFPCIYLIVKFIFPVLQFEALYLKNCISQDLNQQESRS